MAAPSLVLVRTEHRAAALGVPALLQAVVFGSTAILVGLIWDICWHRSIGRDTFWSPPHMAIYLGGIVAGLASALRIFRTTLAGSAAERGEGVRIWGFTGPLGAFFCSWGAGAMITSAPFDDWWHNAYGLDVRILSPPHAVLALGVLAIQLGAMITAVALQNRAEEDGEEAAGLRLRLRLIYVYAAGLQLTNAAIMSYEHTVRILMHHTTFFQVTGAVFPLFLVAAARASKLRWPATATACVYMGLCMALVWVLPLFPAEPKLGPVRQVVTHLVPLQFPLLLVVPALALDGLMRWKARAGDWALAAWLGAGFLAAFLAAQWPFADFLMSPFSRNWIFATDRLPYFVGPNSLTARHLFVDPEPLAVFARGLLLALVLAVLSARAGLAWGRWMSRVRR